MLHDLWTDLVGQRIDVGVARANSAQIAEIDDFDQIVTESIPDCPSQSIAGYFCIITYQNASGQSSQRRITCRRYELAGTHHYLFAFCHERSAPRRFRADRITEIIDPETGEVSEPAQFLQSFSPDVELRSGINWGLAPSQRADLIAGLNALTFMARCDHEWHPLEVEAIERFVTSFWLRREIVADLPLDEIIRHANRLRPDPEAFFGALLRCQQDTLLARIVRQALRDVVDADGRIRDEEHFWGAKVDQFFARL